ncbi:MAG: IPT/TIG domain-containing protein [Flavobacteriales bacterium]|nr:IPT/TIG domain-containing protein [Flavobacteriales bacterium]
MRSEREMALPTQHPRVPPTPVLCTVSGATSASDRALGSVGSGNAAIGSLAYGVLLRNTSGSAITSLSVAFTGEQWRRENVAAQTITFWYKTSSSTITSLNAGTTNTGWTAVTALDFTSPQNSATAAALDGNAGANRTVISAVAIPALSLANNDYIMLRWSDIDHTGSDHGLSIDDVTVSWTVTATPADPTTSSISPTSTVAGTGALTLTVNGTNFVSGSSSVRWNGATRATTFVSSTQLTASILAGDVATAGTATVDVITTGATNTSNTQTFTISAPADPTTTSISPSSATEGGAGFTLTVNGSNFYSGLSTVRWNGATRTTTFVNSGQLTASISAGDIAAAGTATVDVITTGAAGTSNTQTFTIIAATAPALSIGALAAFRQRVHQHHRRPEQLHGERHQHDHCGHCDRRLERIHLQLEQRWSLQRGPLQHHASRWHVQRYGVGAVQPHGRAELRRHHRRERWRCHHERRCGFRQRCEHGTDGDHGQRQQPDGGLGGCGRHHQHERLRQLAELRH